jgi:hypothetical protein
MLQPDCPPGKKSAMLRHMTTDDALATFEASLEAASPPAGVAPPLEALWWDAKGDWDKAHRCAQREEGSVAGAWVHAYLHRKEGDLANAGYWYRRAGKPAFDGTLADEWRAILRALTVSPLE